MNNLPVASRIRETDRRKGFASLLAEDEQIHRNEIKNKIIGEYRVQRPANRHKHQDPVD